jgi:predicted transcriptional regulator
MTAIELKRVLIRRISEINDVSFLRAIKTILDSKADKEILTLNSKQKEEIIASQREIEQGLVIDHDELDKEVSAWLNAK